MRPTAIAVLVISAAAILIGFERILAFMSEGTWMERANGLTPFVLCLASALMLRSTRSVTSPHTQSSRNREVQWGMTLVTVVTLMGVYAPLFTSHDPQYALYGRLQPVSTTHLLGTDTSGRDALARLLFGARLSLLTGISATAIAVSLGATVGVWSAVAGRKIDSLLMRIVDGGLAFPRVFLLLALIALLPQVDQLLLIVVLGTTSWFDIARLVRGEVLSLRQTDYVVATTGLGLPLKRTVFTHILPNVAGPVIVSAALSIGYLILLESGLSYLGVGASAGSPSWGKLIEEGYAVLRDAPQLTLAPGALIALTVIGFSLIGDGLRRILDPSRP